MFDRRVFEIATKDRITTGHLVGEVVATAGLIAVIFALARSGRAALSAAAVGAYIGAAYWFTSSTSFANPAVTIGAELLRHLRRDRAGSRPVSSPHRSWVPCWDWRSSPPCTRNAAATADDVVVPHHTETHHADQRSST